MVEAAVTRRTEARTIGGCVGSALRLVGVLILEPARPAPDVRSSRGGGICTPRPRASRGDGTFTCRRPARGSSGSTLASLPVREWSKIVRELRGVDHRRAGVVRMRDHVALLHRSRQGGCELGQRCELLRRPLTHRFPIEHVQGCSSGRCRVEAQLSRPLRRGDRSQLSGARTASPASPYSSMLSRDLEVHAAILQRLREREHPPRSHQNRLAAVPDHTAVVVMHGSCDLGRVVPAEPGESVGVWNETLGAEYVTDIRRVQPWTERIHDRRAISPQRLFQTSKRQRPTPGSPPEEPTATQSGSARASARPATPAPAIGHTLCQSPCAETSTLAPVPRTCSGTRAGSRGRAAAGRRARRPHRAARTPRRVGTRSRRRGLEMALMPCVGQAGLRAGVGHEPVRLERRHRHRQLALAPEQSSRQPGVSPTAPQPEPSSSRTNPGQYVGQFAVSVMKAKPRSAGTS